MTLTLIESKTIGELANFLYSYLPASLSPYSKDVRNSFPGVAHDVGISAFWVSGGSKLPAIENLLEKTYEFRRNLFSNLILEIVRRGLSYRNKKGEPITYDEIQELNKIILKLKFKIPDLWDPDFLDALPRKSLPSQNLQQPTANVSKPSLDSLKTQLIALETLDPQPRGYAFENFLNDLFDFSGLDPRRPFKLKGEQIDGSIQRGETTYLLEAKWHKALTDIQDLLVFQGKVDAKSGWSRGLFISYSGFSAASLEAFSRGRSTRIIGMTGQDLFFILEGYKTLGEAIDIKARRAAETGSFLVSIQELNFGI